MKTLEEAKIIARSSDPDWVGEELFRLQNLAQQSLDRVASLKEALREACRIAEILHGQHSKVVQGGLDFVDTLAGLRQLAED